MILLWMLCLPACPVWGQEENTQIVWESQTRAKALDWEGAASAAREEIEIVAEVMGTRACAVVATLQGNLSSYLASGGHFAEAVTEGEEALRLAEEVWGRESERYVLCLGHVSSYLAAAERYTDAILMVEEAQALCTKVCGWDDDLYAILVKAGRDYRFQWAQSQLLTKYVERKRAKECEKLIEKSVSLSSEGKLSEAILTVRDALAQARILSDGLDSLHAIALCNLGSFLYLDGQYAKASEWIEQALPIFELTHGRQSAWYATAQSLLCGVYTRQGRLREAIDSGEAALEYYAHGGRLYIYDGALAKMHLAQAYFAAGYYERALSQQAQAWLCLDLFDGEELGVCLVNLTIYCLAAGRISNALEYTHEASQTQRKQKGKDSRDYADALVVEAAVNAYVENYTEATALASEAADILSRCVGKQNESYLTAVLTSAFCHRFMGDTDEALQLAIEAADGYTKCYGEDCSGVIGYVQWLPAFYAEAGKPLDEVVPHVNKLISSVIRNTFTTLTAAERAQFWQTVRVWYEQDVHTYVLEHPSEVPASEGYDAVLLSKGLLLGMETDFAALIQASGDSTAHRTYAQLSYMRQREQSLRMEGATAKADTIACMAAPIEQKLMQMSQAYGDFTQGLEVSWQEVQQALTTDAAAVDFVAVPLSAERTQYVAYVVRPSWEAPRLVPLFEEQQLRDVSEQYTTAALSQLVWQPLDEALDGASHIYFAPAGELYDIAIENVPDHRATAHPVSSRRHFYRLSSTRLLALPHEGASWHSATIYGGLSYSVGVDTLVADHEHYETLHPRGTTADPFPVIAEDSDERGIALSPLPGTQKEAEAIDKQLKAMGIKTSLLSGAGGTEASFKALSGAQMNVLHIGTHGFYSSARTTYTAPSAGLPALQVAARVEDEALTRSGLYLAGASTARRTDVTLPEGVDDGRLTAYEIAQLNLSGLDLVVLSACQTGRGDISGEGVFGLQRGFKKAGAGSIVMSLWNVDDEATSLFMEHFFAGLKADGTGKQQAFLAAQDYIRNYTASDGSHPYRNPDYWAAFILLDAFD